MQSSGGVRKDLRLMPSANHIRRKLWRLLFSILTGDNIMSFSALGPTPLQVPALVRAHAFPSSSSSLLKGLLPASPPPSQPVSINPVRRPLAPPCRPAVIGPPHEECAALESLACRRTFRRRRHVHSCSTIELFRDQNFGPERGDGVRAFPGFLVEPMY